MKHFTIQSSSVLIGLALSLTAGMSSYAQDTTRPEQITPEPTAADLGTVTPSKNPFYRSSQALPPSTEQAAVENPAQNRLIIQRQKNFKLELSPLEQNQNAAPFYEEQQANGTGVKILRVK